MGGGVPCVWQNDIENGWFMDDVTPGNELWLLLDVTFFNEMMENQNEMLTSLEIGKYID